MEPVRVSVSNTRPRLIQQRAGGTIKKRTSARGSEPSSGARTRCRGRMPRHDLDAPPHRRPPSDPAARRRRRRGRLRPGVAERSADRIGRPSARRAPSSGPSGSPAAQVTCPVEPAASPAPVAQASPDPADDPNAARYAEIEGQVSAIRGLTLKSPVQRATFTREELGSVHRRVLRARQPGVAGQGQRGDAQGPPADAPGPVPARPVRGDAHQPGRGAVRRHDEEDVRRHRHGRDRPDGGDHVRPRVHACAAGPGVHASLADRRVDRPGRPDARPDRADRGRRHAADVPVGAAQPDPGRAAAGRGRERPGRPGVARRAARDPARDPAVPVPVGPDDEPRRVHGGRRLRRRRQPVREPARLHRAGAPPREAEPAGGPGRRSPSMPAGSASSGTAGAWRCRTRWASSSSA